MSYTMLESSPNPIPIASYFTAFCATLYRVIFQPLIISLCQIDRVSNSTDDKWRVCATGTISSYQGRPEIVAEEPGQIKVQ
jgi:hypothetical protein